MFSVLLVQTVNEVHSLAMFGIIDTFYDINIVSVSFTVCLSKSCTVNYRWQQCSPFRGAPLLQVMASVSDDGGSLIRRNHFLYHLLEKRINFTLCCNYPLHTETNNKGAGSALARDVRGMKLPHSQNSKQLDTRSYYTSHRSYLKVMSSLFRTPFHQSAVVSDFMVIRHPLSHDHL